MAGTIEQKLGWRIGSDSSDLYYVIRGETDHAAAYSLLESTAPSTFNGNKRQNIDIDEVGGGIWIGRATYATLGPRTLPVTDDVSFTFDTSGGTQHLTHSITTVKKYPNTDDANAGGAIGWDGEQTHGVDIYVPQFAFEVTLYKSKTAVDSTYKQVLYNATGKVNGDTFVVAVDGTTLSFNAGECLFLGVRGGVRRSQDDYELTFRFQAAPNRNNITIGEFTNIEKKGFEYIWVQYAPTKDEDRPLKPTPARVYVEQVYDTYDFSDLGIPSS